MVDPKKEKPKGELETICKIGKLMIEGKEIPIALCSLGEKVEIRVPDQKLLQDLFKEIVELKEIKK